MSDEELLTGIENGRFAIERHLGRGGFGVVYQAYDRHRNARIALKSLRRADVGGIYDFKQEFRTLADLSHPNLVSLYELLADRDHWFIVMELIEGVDFTSYVCHRPAESAASERFSTMGDAVTDDPSETITPAVIERRPLACDVGRLRAVLPQLAQALGYLHAESKLHRDIKPSNVLVAGNAHLTLLDFGLAADLAADAGDTMRIRGTPAYMSPEQGAGRALTEASDWYSVGVMLFEALTGRRPFTGTHVEILQAKQQRDAPEPLSVAEGVPESLNALCRDLLARVPEARPTDSDVVARLDRIWPREAASVRTPTFKPSRRPFVGREAHLRALDAAFHRSMAGHAVTVHLHGGSGMGKSALVRRFLEQLHASHPDVIELSGRCYERESVPYKALDSLVDRLSRYLDKLPREQADALLPRDVSALTRLFPILHSVGAIAQAKHRAVEIPDAQELRRRGFAAFRELLARLSDRHPVVLVIDDLQWGDIDSAALIADVLRPPDPPPLLFVACYRSDEATSSAALSMLLPFDEALRAADHDVQEIVVGELTDEEARALASALSGTQAVTLPVDSIVRESGRSPFLIDELVRYSAAEGAAFASPHRGGAAVSRTLTLESVIQGRMSRLEPGARRLMEMLAVFGRPMKLSLATEAADLGLGALAALSALRAAHLTRTRVGEAGEAVEIYHDRIRETLQAQITEPTLRALHARLAKAFEQSADADPETLMVHLHGAGEQERAAGYAVAAADRAAGALAFDRAARLYRTALELGGFTEDIRRDIRAKIGDALAANGRGWDAAQAYLAAAAGALPAEQIELRRRAAEQLLRSGHIADGLDAIRSVLDQLGMKLAGSPRRALLSLLVRRVQIRLRGLGFRERAASQLSAEALVRVDACWSIATAIGIVDTIRGADFQGRHLLLALGIGDPYRVARAIAVEAAYAALGGTRTEARETRLAILAEGIARRVGHPQAIALVTLIKGTAAFLQGRWQSARSLLEQAEPMLRERCTGVAWELDMTHLYWLLSLFYLGDVNALSAHLPPLLQEARERDDLTAETNLRTRTAYIMHLAADNPEQAREEVRQGMDHWARDAFHVQHSWELYALGEIDLYAGRASDAWTYVNERWTPLRRSLLLRIQGVRIESLYLRARSALAAAVLVTGRERAALVRAAERDAGRLGRARAAWASAFSDVIFAGLATLGGRRAEAAARLEGVEAAFLRIDMPLHARVVRRRRGELVAGEAGARLVREADEWLKAAAIRNPERWTAMLAPGLFTHQ